MVMLKGLIMMFALVVVSIYGDQVDKACQEREKRRECFLLQHILLFLGTTCQQFAPTVENVILM